MYKILVALMTSLFAATVAADDLYKIIDSESVRLEPKVIQWRRYDPELTERMRDTMTRVAGEDNLLCSRILG